MNNKTQDLTNDLATAARKLYVERVASAGFLMGLQSNGKEADTERLTKPYAEALHLALDDCYKICRMLGKKVGKTPQRGFNVNVACDNRCKNAKGYECVCKCNSLYHGVNNL